MISWLIVVVVVVVMGCVVDELMHWVFIIMDWWCELSCWKFWWNFVGLMNCVEKMFWFHVLYGFDCLFMCINVWINFGNEFGVKRIKFGVLGLKIVDSRKGKHQKQGYCSGAYPLWRQLLCRTRCRSSDNWRARQDVKKQQTPFLLFGYLGTNPCFLKCLF